MRKILKVLIPAAVIAALLGTVWFFASRATVAVLSPKGPVATEQRNLIYIALGLMLLVVIPVFIMTGLIAWKYRASNKKARYTPDWDHHTRLELTWWGIPFAIIAILAVIAWRTSHTLDPYKPVASNKDPLTIQVVALQWKWLFIYPGEHVATVNYFEMPQDRPVTFEITADAPMNSFWVPQLGGQVYAMAGMRTQLHLMATQTGVYNGSSANISGKGFASMSFTAHAVTEADFETWLQGARKAPDELSLDAYNQLAKAGTDVPVTTYNAPAAGLYDTVIMKYMEPSPAQTAAADGDIH